VLLNLLLDGEGENVDVKLCPSILSENKTTKLAWQIIYSDRIGWFKTSADSV
jgi:hypothetical protein